MNKTPLLLVGLGNVGSAYSRHRHNYGFMAIDEIARKYRFPAFKKQFSGEVSVGEIAGRKTILLKPATMMNLSGKSVQGARDFFKVDLKDVVALHDELSFELGAVRYKLGGGAAGHNGLRSMTQCLGSPEFARIRLGIDRPQGARDVVAHVLGNFSSDDMVIVRSTLERLSDEIERIAEGDVKKFENGIGACGKRSVR